MKTKNNKLLTTTVFMVLLVGCGKKSETPAPTETIYRSSSTTTIAVQQEDSVLTVKSNEQLFDGLTLNDDGRGCYTQAESKELKNIRICQTPTIVSVFAYLKSNDGIDHPASFIYKRVVSTETQKDPTSASLETPKKYSLQELIAITKKKSFSERQEFDKLKMAKTSMRLHYLNLLPHLSINSIGAIATFSGPLSLLGSIGDLVPFLLPNRWIEARETSHMYRAEKFGEQIAQEDSVQMVEGLTLSVSRDQILFDQLVQFRSQFMDNIKLLKNLEINGKLYPGRSRDLESPLTLFDQTIVTLANVLEAERAELSFAVGFQNPEAIKEIDIGDLLNTVNMDEVNIDGNAAQKIISSSLEIMQMNEMIGAAHLDIKDKFFIWLDPAGDAQSGLGLGLPLNISLAKENVKYLNDVKDQLAATLIQKISAAQNDFVSSSHDYHQAEMGIELQNKRIKVAIDEMTTSPNDTPIGEIQDALNQLSAESANLLNAQFAYLSAKSRMNRLYYQGIYKKD